MAERRRTDEEGELREARDWRGVRRGIRLEALASGFVALLALLLSAYTVYIQQQQLKVQAWPRLAVESDSQPGSGPDELHTTVTLKNRGVAPAEVRAVRVAYEGEDMPDWREWLLRLKRKHGVKGPVHFTRMLSPKGEILGVGQEFVIFATDSARAAAIITADDDTSMSICYCSVLDDCWILELPAGTGEATTTPIARCPTYKTKFAGWPVGASKEWAEGILDGGAWGAAGDAAAAH